MWKRHETSSFFVRAVALMLSASSGERRDGRRTPGFHSPARVLGIVLLLMGLARPVAAADDLPAGDTLGHFPFARFGLVLGLSEVPLPYVTVTDVPDTHDDLGAIVAPQLQLTFDTGGLLVNVMGAFDLVPGGVAWNARGEFVFARTLGFRTHHPALKSISDSAPDSYGRVTTTTEHYVHKHVPLVVGLSGGASLWRLGAAEYTSVSDVTTRRDAATLATLDAGFTVVSPNVELTIGPSLDPVGGHLGLHWVFGMAIVIGDRPFYARITGDHLFGDDPLDGSGRRLSFAMQFAIGVGTNLGLGL